MRLKGADRFCLEPMYDKVGDKKTIQANKDVFWKQVQFLLSQLGISKLILT